MNAQLKPRSDEIGIALIDLDIKNDRHQVDEAQLKELANSIKVQGLIQPILVFEKGNGRFILACGHRRLAAHKLLKLGTIRAEIRPQAPTGEILAARAIENLQRENLSPLEEAEACEALLESHKGDAQAAADAIGWPKRRFENRLALARLSPRVKQVMEEKLITIDHALRIARLPNHKKQEYIVGQVKGIKRKVGGLTYIDRHPAPLSRCIELVEREQQDVSEVDWMMDVPFAGRPACNTCPMRSGNCVGLFPTEAEENPNICLDTDCFNEKNELASRRARMAGHTLAAENLPKNIDGLNKAIAIRGKEQDISFVKPSSAFQAAKTAAENGVGKSAKKTKAKAGEPKKTSAELAGEAARKSEYQARELYDQMHEIWEGKCQVALDAQLSGNPLRLAMLALLAYHHDFNNAVYSHAKPATREKIRSLIALLKEPSPKSLEKIAEAVMESSSCRTMRFDEKAKKRIAVKYPDSLSIFTHFDALQDAHVILICEELGIQIPVEPVLKDFLRQATAATKKAEADKRAQAGDKVKADKEAAQAKKTAPKGKGKKFKGVRMMPM